MYKGKLSKNLFVLVFVFSLMSGCTANPKKKLTMEQRVENIMERVMKLQENSSLPTVNDYKDCADLIRMLKERNIRIVSIKEKEVTVKPPKSKSGLQLTSMSYAFDEGSCPKE